MIPIYRLFSPIFFNFRINLALRNVVIFVDFMVFHQVFIFTIFGAMPQKTPDDRVEDIAFSHPGPCNLWVWDSNGSLWVCISAVINMTSGSGKINTTIQNPNREVVLATVFRSSCSIGMDYAWLNNGGLSESLCQS